MELYGKTLKNSQFAAFFLLLLLGVLIKTGFIPFVLIIGAAFPAIFLGLSLTMDDATIPFHLRKDVLLTNTPSIVAWVSVAFTLAPLIQGIFPEWNLPSKAGLPTALELQAFWQEPGGGFFRFGSVLLIEFINHIMCLMMSVLFTALGFTLWLLFRKRSEA